MDVATRLQTRVRAEAYMDRESNGTNEDSSTESETFARRKFQRTTGESDSTGDITFRKPSLPASASRPQPEIRQNISQRRRSNARDHIRIPSGPREFPSPGKRMNRVGSGSISSLAPSMSESAANATRSQLPSSSAQQVTTSRLGDASRFTLGRPFSNGNSSPVPPASRSGDNLDFMPAVNFDDFQNSLANYDNAGPLLTDFPAIDGRRSLLGDTEFAMPVDQSIISSKPGPQKTEMSQEQSHRRSQSLRRRLSAVPGVKHIAPSLAPEENGTTAQMGSGLSLRTRRQSSATHNPIFSGHAPSSSTGARAPRKSLGPGLISSMMEGRKTSQPLPVSHSESMLKPALTRSGSFSKSSRRTTMQPSSTIVDLPRLSTLTATTQSRANKVKSLQPLPRESDVSTPGSRPSTKGASSNRAHTPSSSGSKRQSTVSGRASGLGARTISPTDARRLKRLSMMQAPPMPTAFTKVPSTPQEEMPPLKIELPQYAQASPSLIPRKTNDSTPNSGRTSPDVRPGTTGGASLTSKSSMQSMLSAFSSTSRLPTPKQRTSHSSTAQYSEEEEIVPPVPAIPKAFESPRESETPFFAGLKLSQSGSLTEPVLGDFDSEGPFINSSKGHRSIADFSLESRRKVSSDLGRLHLRTNTFDAIEKSANMPPPAKITRLPADETGRQNNTLQPLRLPPLNLMPINTSTTRDAGLPRPSQEIDNRTDFMNTQTPEPRRPAKTPSTPMTASKATFFRRQEEEASKHGPARSSTSHFALRDLMQLDDSTMKFFDDSDVDFLNGGLQIPGAKARNTITPFASGSLPKNSGEFAGIRPRPSGDLQEDELSIARREMAEAATAKAQGPRLHRLATDASPKIPELSKQSDSPVTEPVQLDVKKDTNGTGLRRKLSLGWRRSSSKAANHADNKASSPLDATAQEKVIPKAQKRVSEMPPPRLPPHTTWTNDAPILPRPSLESTHRKSTTTSLNIVTNSASNGNETESVTPAIKTRSQHIEQSQPSNNANRASSWGNIVPPTRSSQIKPTSSNLKPRHGHTASTISAIIKDKDDLAADEEMRRLSQKRKDVDTAARESEDLRRRAVARSPMSPDRVLQDRNYSLNIFERGEIMDFEKDGVYFTGTKNARKVIGTLAPSPQVPGNDKEPKAGNYGYDDERGDYNIVLGDHLAYRYEVVDVLGKGSFGQVVRCVDHKEGGVVAVKIIRNKKRFHQQALVEVGILGRLRDWDPEGTHATLSITSSFYFRSHLCIVTPCLSINLYELIRAHNFVGFSLPLIRRFGRQMLACLILLQNKRIIHCDLKPENILLYEARKADIRVIDFGSSCKEEEKVYTYIQSRFYRSPEVILGSTYGMGIDMWSFGCILAELWTGYPLFPGENEQEQLACIMEIFGPPDRHLVERCTRKKLFFDSVGKPRVTVSSKGRRRRPSSKTLAQALKSEDEAFLDFITRCLRWDPDRRMKPHEAVSHPFITNQPFHQRPGIPDEARRAARLRPSAALPISAGGIPSPIKRIHTTTGAIPTQSSLASGAQAVQQTPSKERIRPIPDTPQTTLRNSIPAAGNGNTAGRTAQTSPIKPTSGSRRQSAITSVNAAAIAGTKRASNGSVVGPAGAVSGSTATSSSGAPSTSRQVSSSSIGPNNLAAMAARESISNAARWRG